MSDDESLINVKSYLCLLVVVFLICILLFLYIIIYTIAFMQSWSQPAHEQTTKILGEILAAFVLFGSLVFSILVTSKERREELIHLHEMNKEGVRAFIRILVFIYTGAILVTIAIFSCVQYLSQSSLRI
jgi:hypothetical protein